MPARFLPGEPGKSPGGHRGMVVAIVGVSVLVVGAAAYLLLSGQILKPANANSNTNTNSSVVVNRANANANPSNANLVANANSNSTVANANANLNTNIANANADTNGNTNISTGPTTSSPLPMAADTDGDGLTDVEETLYGSNAANKDTDGDGFIDGYVVLPDGKIGGEVALGYDPTATGRKLDAAGLVREYRNDTGGWAMPYPSSWVFQADAAATGASFVPDKGTGELFVVSVQDNPGNLTAKEWYQSLNPGLDLSNEKSFLVSGLDAFQSLDDSTVFFARGGKVYSLNYNTNGRDTVNYRATFTMSLMSFRLVSAVTNTNAGSNVNR